MQVATTKEATFAHDPLHHTELLATLAIMNEIKQKYRRHEVESAIENLKAVTRTQTVDKDFKQSALQQLSRLTAVRAIMSFEWANFN